MKKRDLILAGLILMAAPLSAQQNGPVRTDQDSKVIFSQDFEGDYDAWSSEVVDQINGVDYYRKTGNTNVNSVDVRTNTDWNSVWTEGFLHRDTLINLYNGVVPTDNLDDIAKNAFGEDVYYTVVDESIERSQAFDEYGIDGGRYVFRYIAGNASQAANYATDNKRVPEYRRNLFVRLTPGAIQPETSYRLTMYVKTHKAIASYPEPQIWAAVMRGYFSSEKPFTMGDVSDNNNYKYNNEFSLTKSDFVNDEWTKITLMTYYLNDSIAENYVYRNGYWWAEAPFYWRWDPKKSDKVAADDPAKEYDSLYYIKQPDKFFVRIALETDSTTYDIDNLSLTKSWIGGVEHSGDMIRVNFGYETNLGALAQAAKEKNKIAAVELPGQYFEVWGMDTASHRWSKVEIASAEYQGDGYMYMWTKARNQRPVKFDSYDSVLVSFTNPDDPELMLKYTGTLFPKALDIDWIKAGKKVPDFHNEASTKNPNIGRGVYSMKNLPPVLQECQYEEGSFNLDGNLREFAFKFSRKVEFDQNADESTNLAVLHLFQDGARKEVWFVKKYGVNDSILVFERPAKYTAPLSGDYEFRLLQLKGQSTEYSNMGNPLIVNYSFGSSDFEPTVLTSLDFNDETPGTEFSQEIAIPGFSLSKCAVKVGEFGGLYDQALMFGLYGVNTGANPDANLKNCALLMYTFDVETPGSYNFAFGTSGCYKKSWNDACKMVVTIQDADGNVIGRYEEEGSNNIPSEGAEVTAIDESVITAYFAAGTYTATFALPNEGSYGGGHQGGRVLYYVKTTTPTWLGYKTINTYKKAFADLNELIAKADADVQYKGADYNAAKFVATKYTNFTDTRPSEYNTVINYINNTVAGYKVRFNVVDSLLISAKEAGQAAYTLFTEGEKAAFKDWDDVKFLGAAIDELAAIKCENFDNAQLRTKTNYIYTKINDLKKNSALNQFAPGQILALKQLADSLGVDFGAENAAIAARVERAKLLTEADAALVSIYKKAITAKIYELLAADINDPKLDSLALTAFIENPGLYVTASINDVEWYNYTYGGAANRWRLKGDIDHVNNVMPGWTIRSGRSQNVHVADEQRQWNDPAHSGDPNAEPVFDGKLAVDWNSTVTMKADISDLPSGMYSLGLNMQNGVAGSYIQGKSGDSVRKLEFPTGGPNNQAADSIIVANDSINVEFYIKNGSGWSYADNFYLIFAPVKEGVDYAALKTAAQTALNSELTFVETAKAAKAKVEYYNINGVKINAPVNGAVNIKVTTLSDGTRIVQKILVK